MFLLVFYLESFGLGWLFVSSVSVICSYLLDALSLLPPVQRTPLLVSQRSPGLTIVDSCFGASGDLLGAFGHDALFPLGLRWFFTDLTWSLIN